MYSSVFSNAPSVVYCGIVKDLDVAQLIENDFPLGAAVSDAGLVLSA